jgi:inner membrane protein
MHAAFFFRRILLKPNIMEIPVPKRPSFWQSATFKLIIIGLLILIMLVPGAMIRNLINEREQTQLEVLSEIGSKWGYGQTINGPVLSIPYYHYIEQDEKQYREIRFAHFLPGQLEVEADVTPEIRYRGIYKTVVYNTMLKVSGSFDFPDTDELKIERTAVLPDDAFVQVGITDMRGIQQVLPFGWNQQVLEVEPGIPTDDISASGFHVRISLEEGDHFDFQFELNLNGSDHLYFVPVGKSTNIRMRSPWKHPRFDGAFLPDKRDISDGGFEASWKVLHLNRNYPQSWKGSAFHTEDSAFGCYLILPVDQYQKTMRSAKYAIMFIALTFMIFFFVEILNKRRIHPVQYLIVGLSISIFYVLLLSLGEQVGFNLSYLISSVAIVGLITAYAASIFRYSKLTIVLGICLALLYVFLFILIQLQDYALLLGSIGLFIAMGLIMYTSRNVDWYSANSLKNQDKNIGF